MSEITLAANGKPNYAKTRKDLEEVMSGLHRQVKAIKLRAMDEDPWAVAEMAQIAEEINAAVVEVVARLREVGYTWTDIGMAFGISATTACKRYERKIRALTPAA